MNNFDAHNATCNKCGMLALRDPWHHAERYGHNPVFTKDGEEFEFIPETGISVPFEAS